MPRTIVDRLPIFPTSIPIPQSLFAHPSLQQCCTVLPCRVRQYQFNFCLNVHCVISHTAVVSVFRASSRIREEGFVLAKRAIPPRLFLRCTVWRRRRRRIHRYCCHVVTCTECIAIPRKSGRLPTLFGGGVRRAHQPGSHRMYVCIYQVYI